MNSESSLQHPLYSSGIMSLHAPSLVASSAATSVASSTSGMTPGGMTPSTANMFQNSGLTGVAVMDDLVREYLLFRGFNACLRSLDQDLKADKDKCLRADKVIEQLFSLVYSFDLSGLLDYWLYLDARFFSRLTMKLPNQTAQANVSLTRKYELFLLRYYLIHAVQSGKSERAMDLFENYAYKLQSQAEWKEWYCLPFLKNPEENPTFSVYFTKNWVDTFIVSLQNFLNLIFQSMQYPRLLSYDEDLFGYNKFVGHGNFPKTPTPIKTNSFNFEQEFLQNDLNDEFQTRVNDQQSKPASSLISMIKSLTYLNSKPKAVTEATNPSSVNYAKQMSADSMRSNDVNSSGSKATPLSEVLSASTCKQMPPPLSSRKLTMDSVSYKEGARRLSSKSNASAASFVADKSVPVNATQQISPGGPEQEQTLGMTAAASEVGGGKLSKSSSVSETTLTSSKSSDSCRPNPYLILSQEDYMEHKASIVHCKFSKDGKCVASLDSHGVIKVWLMDNNATLNTIMQKSVIMTLEWDKRVNRFLYLGTHTSLLKMYDTTQKKIMQEVSFSKQQFPVVLQIASAPTGRLLVLLTSKTAASKLADSSSPKSGQMAICSSVTSSIVIEKLVELDTFFSQSSVILSDTSFLLGCSDGFIRIYELENSRFQFTSKCHDSYILKVAVNKDLTKLTSIASDNSMKIWQLSNVSGEQTLEQLVLSFQAPDSAFSSATATSSSSSSSSLHSPFSLLSRLHDLDLKAFQLSNLFAFDNSETFIFLTNKSGAYLSEICGEQTVERCQSIYELTGASTVELWNASTSCILLVGSTSGTVRVFKLLDQL